MTMRRNSIDQLGLVDRPRAREQFRDWLRGCQRALMITAPQSTGKTCLVKMICAIEPGLAAVHYCDSHVPETFESATLIRSLCGQIASRIPNLGLQTLDTVTLLVDTAGALDHCLLRPLNAMQRPSTSTDISYVIIDGFQAEIMAIVIQLAKHFPRWLRLAITVDEKQLDAKCLAKLKNAFHVIRLDENGDELRNFTIERCRERRFGDSSGVGENDRIVECSGGSWFYVDQLAEAMRLRLVEAPPHGVDSLLEILESHFTQQFPRFPLLLHVIAASRRPPSQRDVLDAMRTVDYACTHARMHAEFITRFGDILLETREPMRLRTPWLQRQLHASYHVPRADAHAAWAHVLRIRRNNDIDDDELLIELAYHLSRCSDDCFPDRVGILRDLGATDLILKCAVIDWPTTQLLIDAGAVVNTDPLQDDLIYLCSSGDSHRVIDLLPSASILDLSEALIAAASRGHAAVCGLILRHAPVESLDYVDEQQWTALRAAACNNHLDVVDVLIANGTKVDNCGIEGRTAMRAAAWSGHLKVVERLLEAGADVDRCDCDGRSALMAAAYMGHSHIVQLLLAAGADPNLSDSAGRCALHLAVSNPALQLEQLDVVVILLNGGADVDRLDNAGQSPLHMASQFGFSMAIAHFCPRATNIDQPDVNGRSPLMLAACEGQLKAMQVLIEAGADIDFIDGDGRTALTHAAMNDHLPVVRMLMQLGADEGHKDNEGAVPLHYACVHNNVELCRALNSPNTLHDTDRYGQHALLLAAQNGNTEVVRLLLECGAPICLQSLDGLSPFRAAALAEHVDVLRIFVEHASFALLDQPDLEGRPLLHSVLLNNERLDTAAVLFELGASISSRDAHGRTALHVVAATNAIRAATLLLDHGIDVESKDNDGRTALMLAAWFGHPEIAHFLLETGGAAPNAQDKQGASALNFAAQLGDRELVVLLLKFGAETSLADCLGRTAVDVAVAAGHDHIQAILKSANGSADSSGFGSMPQTPESISKRCISSSLRRSGIATNPKIRDITSPKRSPLTTPLSDSGGGGSFRGLSLPRIF